jgi:hypothetical protein
MKHEIITFRTTWKLKRFMEQAARKEHRSLSNMIELILMHYLRDFGYLEKKF